MKKILFTIIGALIILLSIQTCNNIKHKSELQVQKSNVSALQNKVDSFKLKEGEWVYKTETLQYTISELRSYNNDLLKKIKEMNVKPGKVEYVSEGEVVIHVHDTIILEADDSGIYSGTWTDPWTTAYFECKDSVLKFDYKTQDSLMLVLYGQKEKFNIFHPFRKRLTSYYSVAKLTRPNSTLVVKSIKFK